METGTFIIKARSGLKPHCLQEEVLRRVNSKRAPLDRRRILVWKQLFPEKTFCSRRSSFRIPELAATYHNRYYYISFTPPLTVRVTSIRRLFGDLDVYPSAYFSKIQPHPTLFLQKKVLTLKRKLNRLRKIREGMTMKNRRYKKK